MDDDGDVINGKDSNDEWAKSANFLKLPIRS